MTLFECSLFNVTRAKSNSSRTFALLKKSTKVSKRRPQVTRTPHSSVSTRQRLSQRLAACRTAFLLKIGNTSHRKSGSCGNDA